MLVPARKSKPDNGNKRGHFVAVVKLSCPEVKTAQQRLQKKPRKVAELFVVLTVC